MATVIEPRGQILHAEEVLGHLGRFQPLAPILAERLVEAFLLNGIVYLITPGPAIEVVDSKAQLPIAVGSQVGRALRRFVRLHEERLVHFDGRFFKVGQYDLLTVEKHMFAIEIAIHVGKCD